MSEQKSSIRNRKELVNEVLHLLETTTMSDSEIAKKLHVNIGFVKNTKKHVSARKTIARQEANIKQQSVVHKDQPVMTLYDKEQLKEVNINDLLLNIPSSAPTGKNENIEAKNTGYSVKEEDKAETIVSLSVEPEKAQTKDAHIGSRIRPWTEDEIKILEDDNYTIKECAELLDRTFDSVAHKRRNLKKRIPKPRNESVEWTPDKDAEVMRKAVSDKELAKRFNCTKSIRKVPSREPQK